MGVSEELKELKGVGDKTAKHLTDEGFSDIISLATVSQSELVRRTDLGADKAQSVIQAAKENLRSEMSGVVGFQDGEDVKEQQEKMKSITTGSDNLDELLGGGVKTQMVTEVYGENSSGKSQLAQQLAVNVQLPKEKGGLDKGCIFIDTEDSYISERIEQLADAQGLDSENVIKNITVGKAHSSEDQLQLAEKAQGIAQDEDIGLIVVDSIIAHFRTEYTGRNELPARQQKLNEHMHTLCRIARNNNCAVYITNQVMSDPGQMYGDPIKPVGGKVLAHNSTTRVYLKSTGQKPSSKKWQARLTDSPYLPQDEIEFYISKDGIVDP